MLSISSLSKEMKNKLHGDGCFVLLLDIIPNMDDTTDEDIIRVCYNNEDIVWKGKTYQAFPFELGEVKNDHTGEVQGVELTVDNSTQAMQRYVEEYNGGNGFTIQLRIVNTEALDQDADVFEQFKNKHAVCTAENITFTLGGEFEDNSRRPLYRYMKNNCRFIYKSVRCGYAGNLEKCNHSLADCRKHNNSARFGGFQGIDQKGVYARD